MRAQSWLCYSFCECDRNFLASTQSFITQSPNFSFVTAGSPGGLEGPGGWRWEENIHFQRWGHPVPLPSTLSPPTGGTWRPEKPLSSALNHRDRGCCAFFKFQESRFLLVTVNCQMLQGFPPSSSLISPASGGS